MYGIYKQDHNDARPRLMGVCYTKPGAKRACKHFARIYANETGHTFCSVRYDHIDSYWTLRLGYTMLCLVRRMETRKLRRLEYEEREAYKLRVNQEKKLASLY